MKPEPPWKQDPNNTEMNKIFEDEIGIQELDPEGEILMLRRVLQKGDKEYYLSIPAHYLG